MGTIELESWNAVIDDIQSLNAEAEIFRLGLVFEDCGGGAVTARATGNVSIYYVIVQELLNHLISGGFTCQVTLSTGEQGMLKITRSYVLENGDDISALFA